MRTSAFFTHFASYALAVATAAVAPAAARAAAVAAPFSHADWTVVLAKYVDARGMVNYNALAKDRATLDRYLAAIEQHSPVSAIAMFPSRNEQLAYYLNAYNAQVFQGVLARGPEQESVWKGFISGKVFFNDMKVSIGGQSTSLKALEDDVIRDGFKDPRIHAALNCASKGCPRLPQAAFAAATLDQELDAGMREFVAEARNCTVDAATKTATLSKIFDWFEKDFLAYEERQGNANPSILDYVNRYRAAGAKVPRDYDVEYFDYDKSVNKQ
jgi:Protein of unknown function, DUF547